MVEPATKKEPQVVSAVGTPWSGDPPISHGDPVMSQAVEQLAGAASVELPVFLSGELGSGKKLAARALHLDSDRRGGPLVTVRCRHRRLADLHRELFGLRRELGGREIGESPPTELSGAVSLASGGTLVLDAPGELAPELQAQLVGVLDENRCRVSAQVRWVATSRQSADELLARGALSEELYYLLAVIAVVLPPLRLRRHDLPLLAAEIVRRSAARSGSPPPVLTDAATDCLLARDWPGNLRQLTHVLERAMFVAVEGRLVPEHFDFERPVRVGRTRPLIDLEREAITQALEEVGGNRRRAAARLGIGLRTLYDKIKRYRIGAES